MDQEPREIRDTLVRIRAALNGIPARFAQDQKFTAAIELQNLRRDVAELISWADALAKLSKPG